MCSTLSTWSCVCAVTAEMAQSASTPRSVRTLRSRTIPAPPLESEPAITRTAVRPTKPSVSEGDQRQVRMPGAAQGLRSAPRANAGAATENHTGCAGAGEPGALELLDADPQRARERGHGRLGQAA